MKAFCTIISPDFVPFAQCLASSLRRYNAASHLHVLITSEKEKPVNTEGISFYTLSEIDSSYLDDLVKKYEGINNKLRWSLKPVLLMHLLRQEEKVIYVDADIHFFGDYNFLFDMLEQNSFLLTPHFASIDPFYKEEKFMMNFLVGLYNAGFVGVNRKAIKSLEWWLRACLYNTADDTAHGFFVDQRYLDMIPVIDMEAAIVRQQGCNIGSWNLETFQRIVQPDGSVLINGKDPVIFIHFNHETLKHIENGDDALLRPYLEQYTRTFSVNGYQLKEFIPQLEEWKKTGLYSDIKRKTSIRSRIKKTLFNLAKKL